MSLCDAPGHREYELSRVSTNACTQQAFFYAYKQQNDGDVDSMSLCDAPVIVKTN